MCWLPLLSGRESIPDPVKLKLPGSVACDAENVKSAEHFVGQLVMFQIDLCGSDYLALFCAIDACQWMHKVGPCPVTNFNKNQYLIATHDQVDLSEGAGVVALYQFQSLTSQEFQSPALEPGSRAATS
jgi:hypothetical protein